MLMNGPFKGDVRTVATAGGIVTIAPHVCAQGLIGAAVQAGIVGPDFMTGDLPPVAAVEMAIAAARQSLGAEP
jgi:hypothetical protein